MAKRSRRKSTAVFPQRELDHALEVLDRLFYENPTRKRDWRINRCNLVDSMERAGIAPELTPALIRHLVCQRVFRRDEKFVRLQIFTSLAGEQRDRSRPNEYLHTTRKTWSDYVEKRRALAKQKSRKTASGKSQGARKPDYSSPSGTIKLFGQSEPPLVNGVPQEILTTARYDVIGALCLAGKKGLTKDMLDRNSGHSDSRGVLYRLKKASAQWEKAICLPGRTGKRYRLQ